MAGSLTNSEKRDLKARAQKLEATVHLGRPGMSDQFLKTLDEALKRHELVKVKFADFKEEKKTLAPQIAEKTQSDLILRVGNVAVYFRRKPEADEGDWD